MSERETEKLMSLRQSWLVTIELCWKFYFPEEPVPSVLHRCSWLSAAPVNTVLDTIEKVAKRTNKKMNPENEVWNMLRRFNPKETERRASA